jgi:conjugal transfer/type IV secretion protein DotA/TraY
LEYTAGDQDALDLRLSGDVLKAAKNSLANYSALTDQVISKAMATPAASPSKPTMPTVQTSFSQSDFLLGGDGVKTTFSKWVTNLGDTLVTGVIYYMEADDDPVMRIKNVGDWMATAAESVMFAKTTIVSVMAGIKGTTSTSALPGASAVNGIVTGVMTFITETWASLAPSMYTVLYCGYFLGVWLPMVPYYIFGIGVVGWIIFVVEMMAAGVLWAAAHTTPTREDNFIGSQTQGYLLTMSGYFRPPLMVLGLVASQGLMTPIVHFINESYVANFRSVQSASTTGPMSIAAYILVYCIIMMAAFMLVYALPQSLPDRILRWIGAGINDMGEQSTASRVESGASSQARNAALAAASKQAALNNGRKDRGNGGRDRALADAKAEAAKANEPEGIAGQSTLVWPTLSEPGESSGNTDNPVF